MEPPSEALNGDASARFRDAEPKVTVDPDGPVDPVCTGASIVFATVIVDARCAVGSTRARELRAALESDAGPLTLAQDAKVTSDGKVLLRLVNTGTSKLTLPLSFHSKLPAFSALAEDEHHAIYELEPPRLEMGAVRSPDAGGGAGYGGTPGGSLLDAADSLDRPHFARIVLPPGGVVLAMVTVSPVVARVIGRRAGDRCLDGGADAAACAITRLPGGRYVLHIGELLTDVEAGAPARVTWELP